MTAGPHCHAVPVRAVGRTRSRPALIRLSGVASGSKDTTSSSASVRSRLDATVSSSLSPSGPAVRVRVSETSGSAMSAATRTMAMLTR